MKRDYKKYYREHREVFKARSAKWRKDHPNYAKEKWGDRTIKLRREVFTAYGGAHCSCCGELEIRFLSIDHVDGGGSKHRRDIGVKSGTEFYRWLRNNDYPPGFQVLCYNCNCGKARNHGVCPHKEIIDGDSK